MGVLYVCDEPSVGLHPVDDHLLIDTLKRLRDLGNTVIIVEHDEAIMRAADHIIDLGPGRGGARRLRGGDRHRRRGIAERCLDHGPVPERPAQDSTARGAARGQWRRACGEGRAGEQPEGHRRDPAHGNDGVHHRSIRLRQEQPDLRGDVQAPGPNSLRGKRQARRVRWRLRHREHRQGGEHRPVAHRPDAPKQPGHLHGRVHSHTRDIRLRTGVPASGATAQAASRSTSRGAGARPARAAATSR